MLNDMLAFCLGLLQGVTALFRDGPLLYLFGFSLFLFVVKVFLMFVRPDSWGWEVR